MPLNHECFLWKFLLLKSMYTDDPCAKERNFEWGMRKFFSFFKAQMVKMPGKTRTAHRITTHKGLKRTDNPALPPVPDAMLAESAGFNEVVRGAENGPATTLWSFAAPCLGSGEPPPIDEVRTTGGGISTDGSPIQISGFIGNGI